MSSTTTTRSRRTALVTAVVLAATGMATAGGTAVAAPPPPGSTVDLAPPLSYLDDVVIAEDAVYFSHTPNNTAAIYRRPLATGPSGTALGAADIVGFGVGFGSISEHDGTLAYTRARDGRLVFRAPDGTTASPTWGSSPDFAGGVLALTDEWVLTINSAQGDEGVVRLVDRQDGRRYDLRDLVDEPAQFTWSIVLQANVSDTRVLWTTVARNGDDTLERESLHTVALGPDGPTGPVVELGSSVTTMSANESYTYYRPTDVTGDRIMWEEFDCDDLGCTETLNWYATAPYSGSPQTTSFEGPVASVEGDVVAVESGATTLEWFDLATPGTPFRSIDTGEWLLDVAGSYVAHASAQNGQAVFSDAAGGAVTASGGLVPSLWFVDVDWSDPFITEVQWMVGEGITTGWPDGTFRNTAPVTREAMAAFLRRMVQDGDAPACATAPFADVPTGHPFCSDIAWLAGTQITTGWPDGTYRGSQPVTREAMAAFLYRLAHDGADAPACATQPFSDVVVGNPFCGEIAWLASTGITTGWPDGTFRPTLSIDRQAMAAFLFRFVDAQLLPTL